MATCQKCQGERPAYHLQRAVLSLGGVEMFGATLCPEDLNALHALLSAWMIDVVDRAPLPAEPAPAPEPV